MEICKCCLSKTTWSNNKSSIDKSEWKMETEVHTVRCGSSNHGDQQKMIFIDIREIINGWIASLQRIGDTSRHNLNREIIIRIILFTSGLWWAFRGSNNIYLTSIIQGEVRRIIYLHLHQILYQVLEESKIIHLIITFRYTFWPLEGSITIKQAIKYSCYDYTYMLPVLICLWTMEQSTNIHSY